ncbi:MAG TPA: hypothetical protein VMD92_10120 [Acidobacteriaceae bacterium]|nr:hypothetical protein [Acidobacteriaceae bacterium]
MAIFMLAMTAGMAAAQSPDKQPVAPRGYTLHESIDLGGRMTGITGSGAMYDTMVNEHSGPRVLGETFELRALPDAKNTLVDSLSAFSNGWGGDPDNFTRLDFHKGRFYDFSGLFRRDRQYFDYDLLGNPNIPAGQSIAISPSGSYAWPQVEQSPFLYNTVRRMTDTSVTLLPLSKVSYRAGYTQDVFQGPGLSPSGYQVAGSYDLLLEEMQRNSTDDFFGAIDWKPVPATRLSFEEQIDHYKANSYFSADPSYFTVQEADGTPAALLANYDSLTPYTSSACNANSVGTTPVLSAPQTAGGLPVVNPACSVLTSYFRSQPTRILYPTEIFRFQSSSIRNVSMNGDVRYTDANMSLPSYVDTFEGLAKTTRIQTYTATASARREVFAADYGVDWQATQKVSFSDQFTFSNVQEPGTATMTSATTVATPATAGNETITYAGPLTTTNAAPGASTFEGSGAIGTPLPDFFGQKFETNDATATWDGWSRATVSLTWRFRRHVIAEGIPQGEPLVVTATSSPTTGGTVTINQNGGLLNIALRPASNWILDGSLEALYADNVFTPVAPRELQHYRLHTRYQLKPWATLSGAYNDMELHNNTNNQTASSTDALDGPLNHVAHSRILSLGADLAPNEHYGFDFDYAYSDVYSATNICYDAAASATLPGAASPSGTACPGATVRGTSYYEYGPVRDFMDAPTQSGSAAITLSPVARFRSNVGYRISSVDGSRFYNDARDVAGSLVSTWQSPFVDLAWTVHPGWIWKAEYNYYGYGEGGPSGAPYCSTSNPTPGSPATVVPCNSFALAGLQTGETISPAGETAPRNFHANNVTLGFHYEF